MVDFEWYRSFITVGSAHRGFGRNHANPQDERGRIFTRDSNRVSA